MKIIKQSYEFITEPDQLKKIEIAGRNCYKSEEYITIDSNIEFVEMIAKRKHFSVFEHGVLHFVINNELFSKALIKAHKIPQLIQYYNIFGTIDKIADNLSLFSINFVGFINMVKAIKDDNTFCAPIAKMLCEAHHLYPIVFEEAGSYCCDVNEDGTPSDCGVTVYGSFDEILPLVDETAEEVYLDKITFRHQYETIRFITDRDIAHEIVRHRFPVAYSQESTRYCNYGKSKFGGLTFLLPPWFSKDICGEYDTEDILVYFEYGQNYDTTSDSFFHGLTLPEKIWLLTNAMIDYNYLTMVSKSECGDDKWEAQQAREILPNDLKTEIIMTAPLYEYHNILTQRTGSGAHPQMRELVQPVMPDFKTKYPGLFDNITYNKLVPKYESSI